MEKTFEEIETRLIRIESLILDLKHNSQKVESIQARQTTVQARPQDDLITPLEACEILKCSLVSLWRYEKKGRVQAYGIMGKKYFKRSEILDSILKK